MNVIKLLAHSPSIVAHWTGVGTAHYRSLLLPKRLRELTILYCAARFRSSYEWDHHVVVSADLVSDAERAVIKSAAESGGKGLFGQGEGKKPFTEREGALLQFLEEVTAGPTVRDELWGEMRRAFCEREIVEVLSLQVSVPGGGKGNVKEDLAYMNGRDSIT